jgi:hypothetical protein
MLENKTTKFSILLNQLSFNKMIETQLAQITAVIPSYEKDRIPGKPEGTMEIANLVTARYDFSKNGWGFPIKKGDPRNPVITCSIGPHILHNAICDLGSSINIMSKETYDKLFYTPLASTSVYL